MYDLFNSNWLHFVACANLKLIKRNTKDDLSKCQDQRQNVIKINI